MAWTVTNLGINGVNPTASSVSITCAAAVAVGAAVSVVTVDELGLPGGNVTDSKGNTYVAESGANLNNSGANFYTTVWVAIVAPAKNLTTSDTITFHFPIPGSDGGYINACSVDYGSGTVSVDVVTPVAAGNYFSPSTNPPTITSGIVNSNDINVAAVAWFNPATPTQASGWNAPPNAQSGIPIFGGNQVGSGPFTFNPAFGGGSTPWAAHLVSFKASGISAVGSAVLGGVSGIVAGATGGHTTQAIGAAALAGSGGLFGTGVGGHTVWTGSAILGGFGRFSGRVAPTPLPVFTTPLPGSPVTLTQTIPSYLYTQYADDDSLQAFVASYNTMAQQYVAWFATGQLANYTVQSGSLLDIVGAGIYGVPRPSLSSQFSRTIGPFNTTEFNTIGFNSFRVLRPQNTVAVTDDVYKRIITWNYYKGDGNAFCVPWLKRRVARFLYGADGTDTPATASTQQISVTVSESAWTITLITGTRQIIRGPFNTSQLNSIAFNGVTSIFTSLAPIPNGGLLREAVSAGVLVLPFQQNFVVNVG